MSTELDRMARAYDQAAKELIAKGANENAIEFEEFEEAIGKSVRAYAEGIGFSSKYTF